MGGATSAGVHVVTLPLQPPYAGPPVQHVYVNIKATIDINARFGFLAPNISIASTQIESYYPHLAQKYREGYRLLVFVGLPGTNKTFGITAMGRPKQMKFHGVFRNTPPEEMGQTWELRIEKSVMYSQMFHTWGGNIFLNSQRATATNPNHIFQTIERVTQDGGRLVGIELTGMAGQEMAVNMHRAQFNPFMLGGYYPSAQVGVDIFYEVPVGGASERYQYQIVNVAMDTTLTAKSSGTWSVQTDWKGAMSKYMDTGWKLVDIFVDRSSTQSMLRMGIGTTMRSYCLWVFEKPWSALNDDTPRYEGTMQEFWFKMKSGLQGTGIAVASVHVENLINYMGQYGWEVVGIVQTPETAFRGFFNPTAYIKCLIFFQRRLLGAVSGVQPASTGQKDGVAPPSYDQLFAGQERAPQ